MSDEPALPDTTNRSRSDPDWFDDVAIHLIEVTQHDVSDIVLGRQYFVLFLEDAENGRFVCSNVTTGIR